MIWTSTRLTESDPTTMMNPSRGVQWRVTITNGLCSFFNVASERYLGLKQSRSTAALSDGVQLVGTADEFLWEVTRTGTVYRLSVPYTNYVLDADTYGTLPGIKLQLYQRWTDKSNQQWTIDTDIFPRIPCLENRKYKIVNGQSGTVMHLEDTMNVSGFRYNEGRNQLWEPVRVDGLYRWMFRNSRNGQYLGIKRGDAARGTRVVTVTEPFVWIVIPDLAERDAFKYVSLHNLTIPSVSSTGAATRWPTSCNTLHLPLPLLDYSSHSQVSTPSYT
ncbi:hypothetical protein CC2G_013466 [Coprinopsis cinerea AmutBmut pab1-1]|nr:hypothetical protein CC2G_013466 [Coprinopsis cinerea AmutBmut pab1-1]